MNVWSFHPLGVVGRGSDTQLQVGTNLNKITVREGLKFWRNSQSNEINQIGKKNGVLIVK